MWSRWPSFTKTFVLFALVNNTINICRVLQSCFCVNLKIFGQLQRVIIQVTRIRSTHLPDRRTNFLISEIKISNKFYHTTSTFTKLSKTVRDISQLVIAPIVKVGKLLVRGGVLKERNCLVFFVAEMSWILVTCSWDCIENCQKVCCSNNTTTNDLLCHWIE